MFMYVSVFHVRILQSLSQKWHLLFKTLQNKYLCEGQLQLSRRINLMTKSEVSGQFLFVSSFSSNSCIINQIARKELIQTLQTNNLWRHRWPTLI
jgi:hypothetical protein